MLNKLTPFLGLVAILVCASKISWATPSPDIRVTSDYFPDKAYGITVQRTSDGQIQGMTYTTDTDEKPITVAELKAGPQLILQQKGYNAVYIQAETDFDAGKGGHIDVRYLTNALFKSYKNFRILVNLQGNSTVFHSDPNLKDPESDRNPYTTVFNNLFFKSRRLGIDKVIPGNS